VTALKATLKRETFTTSRLLEFTSRKELELQSGQPAELWPLVVLKELPDNALDALRVGQLSAQERELATSQSDRRSNSSW
jgi:hypothetical protein